MVSEEDAVTAELVVVRSLTAVPAVSKVLLTVAVSHEDRLIRKVPDETTLVQRIAVSQIHVSIHCPKGVAHGMRVLAKDEWLVAVLLQELFDIFGRRVHL